MTGDRIKEVCRSADKLRRDWGAGNRPARTLFDLADSHNVLVFRMVFEPSVSGAFVRSRRKGTGVIIINTNGKNAHHQRFSLAHELGHLVLHETEGLVEGIDDSTEAVGREDREANLFAAQLLVPLKELTAVLRAYHIDAKNVPDRSVIELAHAFGVSQHVILRRLRIVGKLPYEAVAERIQQTDWNSLWKTYAPDGHADTVPGSEQEGWGAQGVSPKTAAAISRLPRAYREMAFEAYRLNRITADKLAEILGIEDKTAVLKELRPLLKPESVQADQLVDEALAKLAEAKDE